MGKFIVLVVAIFLSVITVLADALIKKAALKNVLLSPFIFFASIIYLVTLLGWFFVLKKIEFLNAGVIYTLIFIIFGAGVSVFYFHEELLIREIIGLILAIVAVFLMYRFA